MFKPGETGNPGGRPKLPDDVRAIRASTKEDIIRAYYTFASMSIDEANEYKPRNLLEAGVLRCFSDFITTGKTDQIRHIWAEVHGKPAQAFELSGADGKELNLVININGNKRD